MRAPRPYRAVRDEIRRELLAIVEQIDNDEARGKSDSSIVLRAGQRTLHLIDAVDKKLNLRGA